MVCCGVVCCVVLCYGVFGTCSHGTSMEDKEEGRSLHRPSAMFLFIRYFCDGRSYVEQRSLILFYVFLSCDIERCIQCYIML